MATQEIKCTKCEYVLATLKTKTNEVTLTMPADPPTFLLSAEGKRVVCPGCGTENMVY